jgi:8-oxo-dGTP diphosphatase
MQHALPSRIRMTLKRDYPDRPLLGVGALIFRDDRILLVRRANPPLEGEWSIPGGLVETGETTKQAIIREVREETGLEVEPVKLVEVFERILRDQHARVEYHFVLIDHLCRIVSGETHADSDVSEVRWAGLEELESLGVAHETCAVIRKAARTD